MRSGKSVAKKCAAGKKYTISKEMYECEHKTYVQAANKWFCDFICDRNRIDFEQQNEK